MLKKTVRKILEVTGYTILPKDYRYPPEIYSNKDFLAIYEKCKPYTMVGIEKSYELYKSINYISKNKIEGDFVECGVWRGGQAMLAIYSLLKNDQKNISLWLYDTYEGMSEPTDEDIRLNDNFSAKKEWQKNKKKNHNEWCYASLQEVQNNLFPTGYPKEKIKFIKGKVEDTIPFNVPEKISILRLDTDWYESTYHELIHLYPKLVRGGVLIIDDYGAWKGSKKAVDEFIQEKSIKILLHKVKDGVIGIKG